MKKTILYGLALVGTLFVASASAASYKYENTPSADKIMETYSTVWNEDSETLSLNSTWDASAGITRIKFLLSDGGSPWVAGSANEQFLWYDLDLTTDILSVSNYKGPRSVLQTYTGAAEGIVTTANSLSLTLDHTLLNSLTAADFAGYSEYEGAGFSDDIGIWYYMYGPDINGRLVLKETLDIHHATPSEVPVPAALFLFAPVLVGLVATRRKLASK
jgi:hypothetical protein